MASDSDRPSPLIRLLGRIFGKRYPEVIELVKKHDDARNDIRAHGDALRAEVDRGAAASGARRQPPG